MTIDEICDLIRSKPTEQYFQVPDDIFNHGSKVISKFCTETNLRKYHNHWQQHGQNTTFKVYGQGKQKVWIQSMLEFQEKEVIKIAMENEAIQEYASNMNTIND
jgi:hypothetical protein